MSSLGTPERTPIDFDTVYERIYSEGGIYSALYDIAMLGTFSRSKPLRVFQAPLPKRQEVVTVAAKYKAGVTVTKNLVTEEGYSRDQIQRLVMPSKDGLDRAFGVIINANWTVPILTASRPDVFSSMQGGTLEDFTNGMDGVIDDIVAATGKYELEELKFNPE